MGYVSNRIAALLNDDKVESFGFRKLLKTFINVFLRLEHYGKDLW